MAAVKGAQEFPGEEEGFADPHSGPPKFVSGNISRTFTAGDTVNIQLPQDAVGGTGGFSYEWQDEPIWEDSGIVFNTADNTITGTARTKTRGVQTVLRGWWQVTDDGNTEGDNTDRIRVVIRINPPNPLTISPNPQTFTFTVGQTVTAAHTPLFSASGGRTPYTYRFVPLPGHPTPPLSSLGLAFDPATNTISGTARGAYKSYRYQHGVTDALGTYRAHTVYIVIARPAPTPGQPMVLNRGRDITYPALEVGKFFDVRLPFAASGGTAPRRWTFTGDIPAGNVQYQQSGAGGRTLRIFGTPSRAGTFTATWTVTGARGLSASVSVTFTVSLARRLEGVNLSFLPGEVVPGITLPALQNARGSVAYGATGTAGLNRLGLRINAATRVLSGVVSENPSESDRDTHFWWTGTDSDGIPFAARCSVTVQGRALTASAQTQLTIQEGGSANHRIVPFSGGVGAITYRATGLPSGLAPSNVPGYWAITGIAPQVDADTTYNADLIGSDESGQTANAPLAVVVEDVRVPVVQQFTLANDLIERADDASGTITLSELLREGEGGQNATYTASHISGLDAPLVSISGRTLTLAAGSSEARRESRWTRTGTRSGALGGSASAEVHVIIYGELILPPPPSVRVVSGTQPSEPDNIFRLSARGGKPPYTYALVSDFAAGSGLSATLTGSTATISGTAGSPGLQSATVSVTDALGTIDTARLNVDVSAPDAFAFRRSRYVLRTTVGKDEEWPVPQPVNADGGVQGMQTIPVLPAALQQPVADDGGRWIIAGVVTATPGVYEHALIATDATNATAQTTLEVDVRPEEGDADIADGGCGPIIVRRRKRSRLFRRGEMIPDEEGLLAIRYFRPSAFVVSPGDEISFDWEVFTEWNGVPITVVELWRTQTIMPFCAGHPNIKPTPDLEHIVTSGHAIVTPAAEGVYLYRLIAYRDGSADNVLSADWWDVTVLATDAPNAIHLSQNKNDIPEHWPRVLQWGFRGTEPTGDIEIAFGPRRIPVANLTARSQAPAGEFDPTPPQQDPNPNVIDGPDIEIG